ncbi:MAG: hypothetical protein ACI84R_004261, partial [Candidatus Azotimanducaceae bacterium]
GSGFLTGIGLRRGGSSVAAVTSADIWADNTARMSGTGVPNFKQLIKPMLRWEATFHIFLATTKGKHEYNTRWGGVVQK